MLFAWILAFSLLGSLGALAGAGLLLGFPQAVRQRLVPVLISSAFHTFVDGVVIAAAFMTSIPLGVTAAIAVVAHEVPQEVGDFAILLESGYGRGKALLLNTLSAAATLPGALAAWFWLDSARALVPFVLAVSAASFIYIASADLIPSLHKRSSPRTSLLQVALLLAGIGTIALLQALRGA